MRILIVDDNEMSREIYASVFRENKFDVITANDGQEGWEKLQGETPPDIVLTGILMPRLGGFALIEKMHSLPKTSKIPVGVISHRGLSEDKQKASELGVIGFFNQYNTTPAEVVEHIKRALVAKKSFRIAIIPDQHDTRTFLNRINTQQSTHCDLDTLKEIILEIEPGDKENTYYIKLICENGIFKL